MLNWYKTEFSSESNESLNNVNKLVCALGWANSNRSIQIKTICV